MRVAEGKRQAWAKIRDPEGLSQLPRFLTGPTHQSVLRPRRDLKVASWLFLACFDVAVILRSILNNLHTLVPWNNNLHDSSSISSSLLA